MSDTAWSPRPVVDEAEPAEEGSRDRRRVLLVGGLALAGLAGVGVLLLNGPDETVLEQAAAPAAPAAAPVVSPSPVATAVPPAEQVRSSRNPFLDPAPPAAVAAQPVGGGAGAPPFEGGALPVDEPSAVGEAPPVAPALPGTQPAPAGPPEPVAPATTLALLRVAGSGDTRTAVFRVGSTQMTAGVGDSFGGAAGLLLLSLQEGPEQGQWTAVVQSGLGDPFDVVTGTSVPLT